MKQILITLLLLACGISLESHAQTFRGIDNSPGDIAYFPDDFAHNNKGADKAIIKILYNRPSKKDREIFGELVPFDKVWRTGANEATEIKLYQDVLFDGKKLQAGTYSLFTIPGEDEWTLIFNKDLDYWGAFQYKEQNDVLRVTATTHESPEVIEAFSIQLMETGSNSGTLRMGWDTTIVELPFSY